MKKGKNMKRYTIFIIILLIFFGCAKGQIDKSVPPEKWVGQVTGVAEGDLDVNIYKSATSDSRIVIGTLIVKIKSAPGGLEDCSILASVRGEIRKGVVGASLLGDGQCSEGSSPISGRVTGTMFKTKAYGTFNVNVESLGSSAGGEWSLEKQ